MLLHSQAGMSQHHPFFRYIWQQGGGRVNPTTIGLTPPSFFWKGTNEVPKKSRTKMGCHCPGPCWWNVMRLSVTQILHYLPTPQSSQDSNYQDFQMNHWGMHKIPHLPTLQTWEVLYRTKKESLNLPCAHYYILANAWVSLTLSLWRSWISSISRKFLWGLWFPRRKHKTPGWLEMYACLLYEYLCAYFHPADDSNLSC